MSSQAMKPSESRAELSPCRGSAVRESAFYPPQWWALTVLGRFFVSQGASKRVEFQAT
jgi:hypothetical protein